MVSAKSTTPFIIFTVSALISSICPYNTTSLGLKPPYNLGQHGKKFLDKEKDFGIGRMELLQPAITHKAKSLSQVCLLAVALFLKEICNWRSITPVVLSNQCIYFSSHSWVEWYTFKWSEVKPVWWASTCSFSLFLSFYLHCSFMLGWGCFCEEALTFLCFCWLDKHEAPFIHPELGWWWRWHRCNRCKCL